MMTAAMMTLFCIFGILMTQYFVFCTVHIIPVEPSMIISYADRKQDPYLNQNTSTRTEHLLPAAPHDSMMAFFITSGLQSLSSVHTLISNQSPPNSSCIIKLLGSIGSILDSIADPFKP
jgi:hypothetical protein